MQKNLFFALFVLSITSSCTLVAAAVFSGNSSSASIANKIQNVVSFDGLLDEAFGKAGISLVQNVYGGSANAIAIQQDGKIVLAGTVGDYFAVARFLSDGTADSTFGAGNPDMIDPGVVIIRGSIANGSTVTLTDEAFTVVIQKDGKIVLGGVTYNNENSLYCFALARFMPNGLLDTTFSNENTKIPGTVFIPTCLSGDNSADSADYIYGVTIQQDGCIVCVGASYNAYQDADFVALARFLSNGEPDVTFGKNTDTTTTLIPGTVFIPHSITGTVTLDYGVALALQPDGKIVVGGYGYALGSDIRFEASRFMPDGTLDSSFGATSLNSKIPGTVFIPGPLAPECRYDTATALVLQPDGKIVVAGYSQTRGFAAANYFSLARLTSDGNLDITFGENNPNSIYPGSIYVADSIAGAETTSDQLNSLVLQNDGTLVAGGLSLNTQDYFVVARFTSTGMPDLSFGKGNPYSLVPGTIYLPSIYTGSTYNDSIQGVAIQPDGKILLGGFATDSGGGSNKHFALVRLFNPSTAAQYRSVYSPVGAGLNC